MPVRLDEKLDASELLIKTLCQNKKVLAPPATYAHFLNRPRWSKERRKVLYKTIFGLKND